MPSGSFISKASLPNIIFNGETSVLFSHGATNVCESVATLVNFEAFAHPASGAAKERYHPSNPTLDQNVVTTGGTGFGLMAILVGIERGYISRAQGVARFQTILNYLETANRFHGA